LRLLGKPFDTDGSFFQVLQAAAGIGYGASSLSKPVGAVLPSAASLLGMLAAHMLLVPALAGAETQLRRRRGVHALVSE
jgi:hypothetical protein